MDNLVLHPFPGLREPDRIVGLEVLAPDGDGEPVSRPILQQWRDASRSFDGIAEWSITRVSARRAGETASSPLIAFTIAGNYFDVLGGSAVLGRPLSPADESTRSPVATLGYECWRRQFGADSSIVGRVVYVNGQPFTIVGVAARGFLGTYLGVVPDLFVPITLLPSLTGANTLDDRSARAFQAVARLALGVSRKAAERELDPIARRESQALGDRPVTGASVQDARTQYLGGIVRPLFVAMIVMTGVLLLVACANVAGILLVRATGRAGEMGLRLAIGGSSGQLARLALLESGLIAVPGAVLGVGIAYAVRGALHVFIPAAAYPISLPLEINVRVLLLSVMLGAAVTALCALLPAMYASRTSPASALRGVSARLAPRSQRARLFTVAAQLAFSVLCLVTAGVFLRGLQSAARVDLGFSSPERVLLVNTDLGPARAPASGGPQLVRDILERVRALPGVEHATVSTLVPLGFGGRRTVELRVEGYAPAPDEHLAVLRALVASDYAATMGITVVEGRDFTETDVERSLPVALVNETLARRFWPTTSPIGRRFDAGRGLVTVVGVLRDGKYGTLGETPQSVAYFDIDQWPQSSIVLHVRTRGEPLTLAEPVRRAMQSVHVDLQAVQPRTLAEHISASTFVPRVGASVLTAFAVLALLLSIVGLHGAVTFFLALRTRDLGIRMALGAGSGAIVRTVVTPALRISGLGLAIGVAVTLPVARILESRLPFVRSLDPVPLLGTLMVLGLASLAAAWLPARRALRVDAANVLRES
jgi:predicted permease